MVSCVLSSYTILKVIAGGGQLTANNLFFGEVKQNSGKALHTNSGLLVCKESQQHLYLAIATCIVMRSNAKDMSVVAAEMADLEGRLSHKPPRSGLREERPRERWFKLRRNLLFYYRLNEHGGVSTDDPAGLFVLENVHVQLERFADGMPFCFSLTLNSDPERRHLMACVSAPAAEQWVAALRDASYESRRRELKELRSKLLNLTGADPLRPFPGARVLKNVMSVEEERESVQLRSSCSGRVKERDASFRSHLVPNGGARSASLLD